MLYKAVQVTGMLLNANSYLYLENGLPQVL